MHIDELQDLRNELQFALDDIKSLKTHMDITKLGLVTMILENKINIIAKILNRHDKQTKVK